MSSSTTSTSSSLSTSSSIHNSNLNLHNPAIKRIMKEYNDIRRNNRNNNAQEQYDAYPLEDNIFEWHFTIRGRM